MRSLKVSFDFISFSKLVLELSLKARNKKFPRNLKNIAWSSNSFTSFLNKLWRWDSDPKKFFRTWTKLSFGAMKILRIDTFTWLTSFIKSSIATFFSQRQLWIWRIHFWLFRKTFWDYPLTATRWSRHLEINFLSP